MYVGTACIIMYCRKYDVSFTSSKRVKERIILQTIFHNGDQFPYKISGSLFMRFICSDIGSHILHYNVLIIICYRRSKRVNGKIICLCTRSEENLFIYKIFKSSTATVIELRFFMKKKMMKKKMKNL